MASAGLGILGVLAVTRPLSPSLGGGADPEPARVSVAQCYSDSTSLAAWCRAHGLVPRERRPKLVCFTLLDTELDILELRVRELADVVDKVVVFESARTSTGRAKQRYFERAKPHFDEAYPVRQPSPAPPPLFSALTPEIASNSPRAPALGRGAVLRDG